MRESELIAMPASENEVSAHTAHYLRMVEHVRSNAEHGYHYHHLMVVFQLAGTFDIGKFRLAAISLINSNAALRNSFFKRGDKWTQHVQPQADPRAFEIRTFTSNGGDWKTASRQAIMEENDKPFSLVDGPLAKIILLDFPEAKVVFGKFHHIICDGWGILLSMTQLLGYYLAELSGQSAPIPLSSDETYLRFAQDENRDLASISGKNKSAWWKTYLAGHDFISNPLALRPSGYLGICPGLLSENCNRQLELMSKSCNFHISYFVHAAYLKALGAYLKSDDILITHVKANRNSANSSVVANFADWIPVRHKLDSSLPLASLASVAHKDVALAKDNYIPYWQIVEAVCPQQYLNDFGITPYSFDFVPAFDSKVDLGGEASFHLLHELQVFPFRLTATDIFCRATQFRNPMSGELDLSIDLIYHSGFIALDTVQAISIRLIQELEAAAAEHKRSI